MDKIPDKDKYIKDFIKCILEFVDSYDESLDSLKVDWKEGSFSFKLSNGKRIIYKPIIYKPIIVNDYNN